MSIEKMKEKGFNVYDKSIWCKLIMHSDLGKKEISCEFEDAELQKFKAVFDDKSALFENTEKYDFFTYLSLCESWRRFIKVFKRKIEANNGTNE